MKRDGEKFDVALEQCEQEYEREILDKNVDYTVKLKNIEQKYEKKKNKFKELEREEEKLKIQFDDLEKIQLSMGKEQE